MTAYSAYSGDELPDFDLPIPSIPAWAIPVNPATTTVDVYSGRHHCRACDVKWSGEAFCWSCGAAS